MQTNGQQPISLFSCFPNFRKAPHTENNTFCTQKDIRKSTSRQPTPHNTSVNQSNDFTDFSNATIANSPKSANQSTGDKDKILKKITAAEEECKLHQEDIQYWNDEIEACKNASHEYRFPYSKKCEAHENLRKSGTELFQLRRQLDSLNEYVDEQDSEISSTSVANIDNANINTVDENTAKSLPRQQVHQEASKGKKDPVLGKFGKLISHIFPEKFIAEHMSKSFNTRYLNTKKAALEKRRNALEEMYKKLVSYRQATINEFTKIREAIDLLPEMVQIQMRECIARERLPKSIDNYINNINKLCLKKSKIIPELKVLNGRKCTSDEDIKNYLDELIKIIDNKIKNIDGDIGWNL